LLSWFKNSDGAFMSIERNKQCVLDFFDLMNQGDADAIADSYADGGEVQTKGHTLISGTYGKEQIRAFAGQIYAAFPSGITFEILTMTAEGDRVSVEAASKGDHISGQLYTNEYHFLFELTDGKIRRLKEYMDTERATDILCDGQRPQT